MSKGSPLDVQLFINGEFTPAASGNQFAVVSPIDDTEYARVATAGPEDIDRATQAAHRAFCGSWPRILPFDRGRVLQEIANGIRLRSEEIATAETMSGGKTISNSLNEVSAAARVFEYYAGAMDKFFGTTIPMGAEFMDFTIREPVGVVAQITPWNFPFLAAAWKVAPALAAGCTVILKPASNTPVTSLLLAEVAHDVNLPPGVLNILPGPGAALGRHIATHPLINKIAFTGEGSTGAALVKAAADDIKRVTLELGGKSPNIIFADANLEKAGKAAVSAAFGNAGQSCSARTRILVERSVHDKILDLMIAELQEFQIGNPLEARTDMGPMVSKSQWNTVRDYISIGVAEGATLSYGGDRPAGLRSGHYLEPTVFTDVHNSMRIAREEIFGPVAALIPFETESDAIAIANDSPFGLNASVWTRDVNRALRIVRDLETGMVSVNSHGSASRYSTFTPFGGMKKSGIGRELGMQALELYTELKNVIIDISDTTEAN
ncbi:MAG: aldehyde dehydrogenase family protein [Pseudomonadota bacterium]|nr:aldehyde dehydrogenase family protein [Pseudomonadota bacterium]